MPVSGDEPGSPGSRAASDRNPSKSSKASTGDGSARGVFPENFDKGDVSDQEDDVRLQNSGSDEAGTEMSSPTSALSPKMTFRGKNSEFEGEPKMSFTRLDSILDSQFGTVSGKKPHVSENSSNSDKFIDQDGHDRPSLRRKANYTGLFGTQVFEEQSRCIACKTTFARVVEHRLFTACFIILTVYALFAPDVDSVFGSRQSKYALSIVTSLVFCLFVLELLCQSCVKNGYLFGAYFWLDLAALLSLLPDTWMVQHLEDSNSFVAGRTSQFSRIIALVGRSSRAARLNRLTRMVRVAALIPKVAATFRTKASDEKIHKLLDRKFHRIFSFLDEDTDGVISQMVLDKVLERLTKNKPRPSSTSSRSSRSSPFSTFSSLRNYASSSPTSNASRIGIQSAMKSESPSVETTDSSLRAQPESQPSTPAHSPGVSPDAGAIGRKRTSTTRTTEVRFGDSEVAQVEVLPQISIDSKKVAEELTRDRTSTPSSLTSLTRQSGRYSTESTQKSPEEPSVSFEEFSSTILEDDWVKEKLFRACRQQIRKSESMQNIGMKHVEDVGVKVALGVLLLLLVLSFLTPVPEDWSGTLALEILDTQARVQYSDWNLTTMPLPLQEQVILWMASLAASPDKGNLLYLDVSKRIVCTELELGGSSSICPDVLGPGMPWNLRVSLQAVDEAIQISTWRKADLLLLRLPVIEDVDISLGELERQITSVALVDARKITESEAIVSIITTVCVIVIIILGITTLTKDLASLSTNLLKPLRSLTEEMQSIAQMQLAGLEPDGNAYERGTAEVRLIHHIFAKTKTAIRSWGKYVPWPVVQLLLAAGVDASPAVSEKEVSMFFSDIAGFTSIIEKLPPERSLLLLSRYFNDMSQVIDDHGGIVIEFIGDAILSVYGAPVKNRDHPEACVRATLKMLRALERVNDWSKQHDLPKVGIRCGIHTGEVLCGNMGFHSRMKYGIVGENANIPAKLEEMNNNYGTNNLMSEATYNRLSPTAFIIRPIDYVYLRQGRGNPGEVQAVELVFNVLGVLGKSPHPMKTQKLIAVADDFSNALEAYRGQVFGEALEQFTITNKAMKEVYHEDDEPSLLFIKRCRSYLETPPPEGWDGVWDRTVE